MISTIEINVPAEHVKNYDLMKSIIARKIGINVNHINDIITIRRSIDARNKNISYLLKFEVYYENDYYQDSAVIDFLNVSNSKPVIIAGAGPAGLFAALKLIKLNYKPIILERGKDVYQRKRDIAKMFRSSLVDNNSNYCFGEGGAGTFSDGKLFTRSNKRGDIQEVLKLLVYHGASEDILVDAHPHIGSDMLPIIIENIRKTIVACGGQYFFNTHINNLTTKGNVFENVIDDGGNKFGGTALILATGHSADDIYELLSKNKILTEPKNFAMGVRVEHEQALIDEVQYHGLRDKFNLPAATYSLVTQVDNKGVFSFCMCPGGIIIPSHSNSTNFVVNGMSSSFRNGRFANAGIVVGIDSEDTKEFSHHKELQNLYFRQSIEKKFILSEENILQSPAQRMDDFIKSKVSQSLKQTSFVPGLVSVPLQELLPCFICNRLKRAFFDFDKKLKGFNTSDAMLIGLESRTSSPIRILRNPDTLEHVNIHRLFPCGEGSGYSGGIVSSALDGINVAKKIAELI